MGTRPDLPLSTRRKLLTQYLLFLQYSNINMGGKFLSHAITGLTGQLLMTINPASANPEVTLMQVKEESWCLINFHHLTSS